MAGGGCAFGCQGVEMLVVVSEAIVPPGGNYVAKHDISGAVFRRHTVDGVCQLYNEHCRANGYPELCRMDIVQIICRDTPANICRDENQPTFVEKAVSFVGEMTKWAASGFKVVSQEILDERLAICQKCNYWGGLAGGKLMAARCGRCSCSGLKLALATTRCPLNPPKWSAA